MNAFNNATYLGKFVKYIGKTNDTYVKDAIYQVTNDATEYDRYMLLPTLENEAQPSELAEGKELISSLGAVVVGTGNIVLKASTTEGMQALFTEANIGKLVQYLGDSDVYIKDAIYQIVDTSVAKQYYELPVLTSEGTADDLAIGKELINSNGEKVVGNVNISAIVTGNIQATADGQNTFTITGIPRRPKIIVAFQNGITGRDNVMAIVSDPRCVTEEPPSNTLWLYRGSTSNSTLRYHSTFDYDETNKTVTINSGETLSFARFPLPYAIAY